MSNSIEKLARLKPDGDERIEIAAKAASEETSQADKGVGTPVTRGRVRFTWIRVTAKNRDSVVASIKSTAHFASSPEFIKRRIESAQPKELYQILKGFKGTEPLGEIVFRVLNGNSGLERDQKTGQLVPKIEESTQDLS